AQGARVTVTDLKTKEQLKPQLDRLGKQKINFVLGKHREQDFKNADLIVKNPGVPKTSKYLEIARKKKIPIETDISLFFQMTDRKRIIGITGTRGKSTTASLIYDLIHAVDKHAVLGGNITRSPLAQLAKIKKGGMVVLELSSWMLESLEKTSPHISVFTNLYPDHLNTYSGMEEYASAKKNIFKSQNLQDFAVLNRDNGWTKKMGSKVPSQRFWFSLKEFKEENGCFARRGWIVFRRDGKETKVLPIKEIKLLGKHNLENVLASVCVGMISGLNPSLVRKTVKGFKGVPDRLELLKEVKEVKFYNDTTSTTPEATLAALSSFNLKKIVLLAGGADKGLDFKKVVGEMQKCKKAILFKGSGTERILKIWKNKKPLVADSMGQALDLGLSFARKGDIIILSPACASFGLFNNEFDRGGQFRKLVKELK
ncbi:MAG: UDP-N-acetylmuramoyl-L-alanine--D-glutamate ligase, partial [Patescibacteria group bacterium]